MDKKEFIDFILHEDEYEKLVFRFLPQESHCHSFGNKPPTCWNGVYKVYYSYKIFRQWEDEEDFDTLFYCGFDECSVIGEIAERIRHIVNGEKTLTIDWNGKSYIIQLLNDEIQPMGDGVSWTINELRNDKYEIILWKYNQVGYRFWLDKDKLKEFGEYLNECCEYMLAHGEPI